MIMISQTSPQIGRRIYVHVYASGPCISERRTGTKPRNFRDRAEKAVESSSTQSRSTDRKRNDRDIRFPSHLNSIYEERLYVGRWLVNVSSLIGMPVNIICGLLSFSRPSATIQNGETICRGARTRAGMRDILLGARFGFEIYRRSG